VPEQDVRRKLAWLIGIRVGISTLLLGSAVLAQINFPGALPIDPFFFLIGLTYALAIVWGLTLKHAERHRWLIDVQLACDALVVSAFIYVTGGVTSYFSSLYTLPIIAASMLQFRRGGLLVAVLSAVVYGGLILAQYFGAAGWLNVPWLAWMGSSPVLPARTFARYSSFRAYSLRRSLRSRHSTVFASTRRLPRAARRSLMWLSSSAASRLRDRRFSVLIKSISSFRLRARLLSFTS